MSGTPNPAMIVAAKAILRNLDSATTSGNSATPDLFVCTFMVFSHLLMTSIAMGVPVAHCLFNRDSVRVGESRDYADRAISTVWVSYSICEMRQNAPGQCDLREVMLFP
jgi:hypothetical protein